MALEYTYNNLSAAIQNWMEDQSVELVDGAMPGIIGLAEQRILKDLQLSTFDATVPGMFVADSPVLDKPLDAVQTIVLYLVENQYHTIAAQDETDFDGMGDNGTFTGGTGYEVGDSIVLTDATTVVVDDAIGGVVTEFTIIAETANGAGSLKPNQTLEQNDTDGDGEGFSLTLGDDNETLDTVASKRRELKQRTMSYLRDLQAGTDTAGLPEFYTDLSDSAWVVTPAPDFGYAYEAQCIIRPASLVEFQTIAGQTEADFDGVAPNGVFLGGTGYAVADTITLSDGTVITVDDEAAGVVTEFTVTSISTDGGIVSGPRLVQAETSGAGSGFVLRLGTANQQMNGDRTSWLSTRLAELLFYACVVESEKFLKSDIEGGGSRSAQWNEMYAGSLETSRFEMRRWSRESYAPMKANQGGAQ